MYGVFTLFPFIMLEMYTIDLAIISDILYYLIF